MAKHLHVVIPNRSTYWRVAPTIAACFVCATLAAPSFAISGNGPDDLNTVELLSTGFINSDDSEFFDSALSNSGFTPDNGWTVGSGTNHFDDLSYFQTPWVVTSPTFTDPSGGTHNRGVVNQDAGGENFQLIYTPSEALPGTGDIHFLQILDWKYGWNGFSTEEIWVDNGFGGPKPGSNPFYDSPQPGQGAGIHGMQGTSFWMFDTPYDEELEREDFWAIDSFETYLVRDFIDDEGDHTITTFGGVYWGYSYTTSDIPEPATLSLLAMGGLLLLTRRRVAR